MPIVERESKHTAVSDIPKEENQPLQMRKSKWRDLTKEHFIVRAEWSHQLHSEPSCTKHV
jgi:hypothetical protein